MAPLIVHLAAWAAFYLAARLGAWSDPAPGVASLRYALAAMFCFTAVSHFVGTTRRDFIRMVPASLPAPGALVALTGALQLAGAAGLLFRRWDAPAALCLALLLVAMTPANVRAGREHLAVAGRPAMSLWLRLPLQLFWIACLCAVASAGA